MSLEDLVEIGDAEKAAQIAALTDLEAKLKQRVTELSERLQAKHHGMVALISRCEGLGLVRRQSSAVDQRRVEVHLTAEGERYVDLLARQHREELETFSAMADLPRHPR